MDNANIFYHKLMEVDKELAYEDVVSILNKLLSSHSIGEGKGRLLYISISILSDFFINEMHCFKDKYIVLYDESSEAHYLHDSAFLMKHILNTHGIQNMLYEYRLTPFDEYELNSLYAHLIAYANLIENHEVLIERHKEKAKE